MVDNLIVVNYNIFGGFNLWQTMEFILFALVTYGVMWVFIYVIAFLLLIIIMPLMIIWEVGKLIWSIKSEKVISPPINKPATPAPTIKELSKKEKTELVIGLAFIGYTAAAIGIAIFTDLPIGIVIAGWIIATIIATVWSNKKLERFDDKPLNEQEKIDMMFGAVFIGCSTLLIAVILYSNSDALIGFSVAGWLVITAVMGFWAYKKRKRIKNQDQDNP